MSESLKLIDGTHCKIVKWDIAVRPRSPSKLERHLQSLPDSAYLSLSEVSNPFLRSLLSDDLYPEFGSH